MAPALDDLTIQVRSIHGARCIRVRPWRDVMTYFNRFLENRSFWLPSTVWRAYTVLPKSPVLPGNLSDLDYTFSSRI